MIDKENIPESIKEELYTAVIAYDLVRISQIHNEYNIGKFKVCCPRADLVPHYEAALGININVYDHE